nr:C40 family peptidase [Adlercreutzia sp. ZJ473]
MRACAAKGTPTNTAAIARGIASSSSAAADAARMARASAAKRLVALGSSGGAKAVAIALALSLLAAFAVGAVAMPVAGSLMQTSVASSYASADQSIKDVDAAYSALEAQVEAEATGAESRYPGYDEYRYRIDEIGHDPYALAALLTARYGEYDLAKTRGFLDQIASAQYALTYAASTETEQRDVVDESGNPLLDESGNPVKETHTARIMTVSLSNTGIAGAAAKLLTDDEIPHYQLLAATKGNRDDLFKGSWTTNPSTGGFGYSIPAEALKDAQFAAMVEEAEKYLGYPYVWGGSSPSTSFDCSGFVCWVVNHSVGDVGRTTAEGLRGRCSYVSPSEARPGDLVFFQNTYPEVGASHVGIYVGGGMMIHCGDPIQYASIETSYWQQHFLAFGRLHG